MPPPKFSRSFEAVYAEDVRRRHASPAPPLELGVKGRLNNQEMEMLRQKLAQATAYDHTPVDKASARQSNVKRPPQFVRASPSTILMDRETVAVRSRARKKPLAVIHEEQEKLNRFEPQYISHPTRGIDASAKARLQDEYNTKPRQVSTVPLNLMENNQGTEDDAVRAGKRLAPAAIPQVFLL
ncbi:hypothetical protein SPRG_12422 [Saprolegnia parasitica CBS 223.65]|uniref:Uncharacterized protein n=1 Tax=Saprolegnia parasitica (strain CBS 223.65) TaxID=695850 RepID=A0A067BX40_SAPPC|nr:hypothetical protein SPRG_12422 [Saprolegnia parasitica CBS 223.65]KDO21415.1 hypothetical protein SPRG_12422 [Saprolegnia parasitica CBS 223.65]|eukprot:XP_012207862.1 hypothetical protein SPRG_12422 [Saprolegnia parasitica CBS 223.65]